MTPPPAALRHPAAAHLWAMLPKFVLCGADYDSLRKRPKEEIHLWPIAQLNHPNQHVSMDLDVDHDGTETDQDSLPRPTYKIIDLVTGYHHVGLVTDTPLRNKRKNVRAWLEDTRRGMVALHRADPRHHGRGPIPNPFHECEGRMVVWGDTCGGLEQLADWITRTVWMMEEPPKPGLPISGTGRNVSLYLEVTAFAWRAAIRDATTKVTLARLCRDYALGAADRMPSHRKGPLGRKEVLGIARSAARQVWDKIYGNAQTRRIATTTLSQRQARRGKIGGMKRRKATRERDRKIKREYEKGMDADAIAGRHGVSRQSVYRIVSRDSK